MDTTIMGQNSAESVKKQIEKSHNNNNDKYYIYKSS